MLKTNNIQSAMLSNRFILGIFAFGVSFGLSLFFSWDFNQAFLTGITTVPATYLAAWFVDKRRRNYEMLILDSLHNRIRELENLKSRIAAEVNQLEVQRSRLYTESNQIQNQVVEWRSQRDVLNRELSTYIGQKKQLEVGINNLQIEIDSIEKNKAELNKNYSVLATEKRRLEMNCNLTRTEISQLQNEVSEIQQQKTELENSLILMERLKPQLEEKLYDLRVQIQGLQEQQEQLHELILNITGEKEDVKRQIAERKTELQQLQEQIILLEEERNQLQTQVWELLQQVENFNQEPFDIHGQEEVELFPFAELMETLEPSISNKSENLPEEWIKFLRKISSYETQVLKAIVEQDNPNPVIKEIAEANITMPNLLIDTINELAHDNIGDLIIEPNSQPPQIYQEYLANVKKLIAAYEDMMTKQLFKN